MKLINKIILLILVTCFISCTTVKYVTIPLTQPPEFYKPLTNIQGSKDLIKEYQRTLIHIKRWQYWYDVNADTNYFYKSK